MAKKNQVVTEPHPPMLPQIVEAVGKNLKPSYKTAKEEYDVLEHDVFIDKKNKRPRKKKKDGELVEVNRIGLPLQKLIVNRRVAFMNVGAVQLEANPKTDDEQRLYDMVMKIREDVKIEFIEDEIATRMLSELQVAKLWYSEQVDTSYWGELSSRGKFRMRCQILSPEKGDTLLPVFDSLGNLIYFGRLYESTRSFEDLLADETLIGGYAETKDKRFDIYSKSHIYKFRQARQGEAIISTQGNNGWIIEKAIPHAYGKIPVIYYSKPSPPWADVQHAISRLETVVSNFADTNDYHASPTLVFIGEVGAKMLDKGEQGKAVEIRPKTNTTKADVKYVTWEHAPESIRLEIETLSNFIFTCTQTPQMSMEDMKGLGAISGVAYDRIFTDAHLAAKKELKGEYGMGTQRDINLQKAFCAAIDTTLTSASKSLDIKYDIPLFRINDDAETISTLDKAHKGGMLSQKTMVEYSPLTKNAEEELAQIQKEKKEAMELAKQEQPETTT